MEEEQSQFKLLVTVNADRSPSVGRGRRWFANLIGEKILDAWHGTDVAGRLVRADIATDELVEVHKELLYSEQAVLILSGERIRYHFECEGELLSQAAWFIANEIEARQERGFGESARSDL